MHLPTNQTILKILLERCLFHISSLRERNKLNVVPPYKTWLFIVMVYIYKRHSKHNTTSTISTNKQKDSIKKCQTTVRCMHIQRLTTDNL